jgi:ATP-dependent Clp protease ATP-binding subunit ClpC
VVFHKLTHDDLVCNVDLELAKVNLRLKQKNLALEMTPEAKEYLVEMGTDEKFGARPLRRTISNKIEDPLSEDILRGKYAGKAGIRVSVQGVAESRSFLFEGVDQLGADEQRLAAAGAEAT